MQIDSQSQNILKILASEGSSSLPQKFIQQINLGQILKGQVIQILTGGNSLLNFGGQKIIVEGASAFQPGQTITARVEQLQPTPVLKILSSSTPSGNQEIQPNGPAGLKQGETIQLSSQKGNPISYFSQSDLNFLKLSQGKVYRVGVQQIQDAATAVIQWNQKNFLVRTDGSQALKPGDQIPVIADKSANGSFHLLQTGGPVISRVTPGMIKPYLPLRESFGEMAARLGGALKDMSAGPGSGKGDLKEVMARLSQTIQLMTSSSKQAPSAQAIKNSVDISGIQYEAKVKQFLENGFDRGGGMGRDLKGQLLEIIKKLEIQTAQKSLSSAQMQTLKDQVQIFRQAADNIELHQLTNQLAKQEGQSLLLQIPNPFGHGDPTLKLYVRSSEDEESEGTGKEKQNFNLVFLLELSELGNLRVDSQVTPSGLAIKMTVENQSIADFIASESGSFTARMADMGFAAELTCCVQETISMEVENDLPEILKKDEFRLVDVTT